MIMTCIDIVGYCALVAFSVSFGRCDKHCDMSSSVLISMLLQRRTWAKSACPPLHAQGEVRDSLRAIMACLQALLPGYERLLATALAAGRRSAVHNRLQQPDMVRLGGIQLAVGARCRYRCGSEYCCEVMHVLRKSCTCPLSHPVRLRSSKSLRLRPQSPRRLFVPAWPFVSASPFASSPSAKSRSSACAVLFLLN